MPALLAITVGDVAGIGPEVVIRSITGNQLPDGCVPLLIGPLNFFQSAAELCGLPCRLEQLDLQGFAIREAAISMWQRAICPVLDPTSAATKAAPLRIISAESGDGAFRCLTHAIQLTRSGITDAIVTAPLNKESLHLAGHHFPGHTEILAEQCGVPEYAMMLHLPESSLAPWRRAVAGASSIPQEAQFGISIAHVTLHTSIKSVPKLLTTDAVAEKIRLMDGFLKQIQCQRRSIAVCALNPHGGEHGLFGDEEGRIIEPAVQREKPQANVHGPLPVDTLIRRAIAGEFDGVVAMYHDQGHIPVKLIGFDSAINITLGLTIIRTSPTHGTAFDRAWNTATPANPNGMIEAIRMAAAMCSQNARH